MLASLSFEGAVAVTAFQAKFTVLYFSGADMAHALKKGTVSCVYAVLLLQFSDNAKLCQLNRRETYATVPSSSMISKVRAGGKTLTPPYCVYQQAGA